MVKLRAPGRPATAQIGSAAFTGRVIAGRLEVDDVVDNGVSYRALVGVGPSLTPITLEEITDRGGTVSYG